MPYDPTDPDRPDRITLSPKVNAIRSRSSFAVGFPYHPPAVAEARAASSARYDSSSRRWLFPVHHLDAVVTLMERIHAILVRDGIERAEDRSLRIEADWTLRPSAIMEAGDPRTEPGAVFNMGGHPSIAERVGEAFTGSRETGILRPDLHGRELVRVWYRTAMPDEIAAFQRRNQPEPEPMP